MSTAVNTNPVILPEHVVGHSEDDTEKRNLPQSVRLPDLYEKFDRSPRPSKVVRYRIKLDTSYLVQSYAIAEVWTGWGWVELCQLKVEQEFYVTFGPDVSALDPRTRELARASTTDRADYIAKSWQKVVNRLSAEAEAVLDLVDG